MKVKDGSIQESGKKDILGMALGNPEHSGQVRGVEGMVTPTTIHPKLCTTKFLPLLPKKYYLIPRQRCQKLVHPFCVCDGPKYLYKFIALLRKDYYLIPSNNAMKLVCCVPYLLY